MTFHKLGLAHDVSDLILWRTCQERDVILITGNRNGEGAESLKATLRIETTSSRLPVLTISNPAQVFIDGPYAAAVAERLLGALIDIEAFRVSRRVDLS